MGKHLHKVKNFLILEKIVKIFEVIKRSTKIPFVSLLLRILLRCAKWIVWIIAFIWVLAFIIEAIINLHTIFYIQYFIKYVGEWISLVKDWNFFFWMIALGQFWVTKIMIVCGADVNFVSEVNNQTPLMIAARFNNSPKIVKLLIQKGADPFFISEKFGSNVLMSASAGGTYQITKIILDLVPQNKTREYVNLVSIDQNTALLHNLDNNPSLETVKLLVENEANVNYVNVSEYGYPSALRLAAIKDKTIFEYLISKGGNINLINPDSFSLLEGLVLSNKPKAVKLLVQAGADFNYQNKFGDTALIHAVEVKSLKIAKILINAGADLNIISRSKGTALHCAVQRLEGFFFNDPSKMVQLLIKSGADLNIEYEGKSPFFVAARSSTTKVLKLFIKAGVDINQTNSSGRTALMQSIHRYENVKFLIKNGIDIYKKDKYNSTALEKVVETGSVKLIKLLINLGLDVNNRSWEDWTPIMKVPNDPNADKILKILINAGANINAQEKDGNTALMLAIKKRKILLANFLIEAGANTQIQNNKGHTAKDFHQVLLNNKLQMNREGGVTSVENLEIKGLYQNN